jgi:small subunit ribosomal protein S8e
MGISRDSRHKRRRTGGRVNVHIKKRKYEMGRPPADTKLGTKRVHVVRTRGGNQKFRGLRLDSGTFSWGSEVVSRRTRILDVVYNATNGELVRTKTLLKGAIVAIDGTAFRQWYEQHYGVVLGKKKKGETTGEVKTNSKKVTKKLAKRCATRSIEQHLKDQFNTGRILARISSRPGQVGRCDGYILEGAELDFYLKKMKK